MKLWLFLLPLLVSGSSPHGHPVEVFTQVLASPSIPLQTDDGLDPITLIWTGYAPAWWVAANLNGWSDTAYCSSAKTVNGAAYNYTLEQPDPGATPCIGPRDHVRIWDMGYSSVYGRWSIGSAHHEHTVCFPCHHVIDSWERAESDIRSSFTLGQFTTSISNFTLANAGIYQGIYNDGNATLIELKPPPNEHPVVFNENGMRNGTSWSVTLDGTTMSSQLPDIIFSKPNGTYSFTIVPPSGYNATPSSGTITVTGPGATETILFRVPWTTSTTILHPKPGTSVPIGISGNATIAAQTIRLTGMDRPVLSFNVTEIGTRGVLNVTIPRSAAPPQSSVTVLVDGIQNGGTEVQQDAGNYYVFFVVPYGTHSVELQFTAPQSPYLVYIAIGAVSAGMIGLLFLVRNWRKRKLAADRAQPSSSQNQVSAKDAAD
jgi:hypothetical protein